MIIAALLASSAAYPAPIRPLAPLVGHCWATRLSAKVVDRHCFSALFGGRHVRDVHAVTDRGRTVYSGETIYSAEGPALTFLYINSMGGVGRGSVAAEGYELRFRLVMRAAPDSKPQSIDTRWRLAARSYLVTSAEGVRQFRLDDR